MSQTLTSRQKLRFLFGVFDKDDKGGLLLALSVQAHMVVSQNKGNSIQTQKILYSLLWGPPKGILKSWETPISFQGIGIFPASEPSTNVNVQETQEPPQRGLA